MKGIDPKWAMYLGLAILLEQTIGHGGAALLTGVVPASWIDHITATANLLATLGTVIMTYQASVSSPLPGPLVNTTLAPVAKPVIMLAVLVTGLILMAGGAHAATKAPAAAKVTKTQALTNPLSVIQTFTESDLTAALTDAKANNDLAAVNCYSALLPIVQSGVANPLPAGLGGFQLLQKARDLKTMLANLQSPNGPMAQLNLACAPLVLDVQNTMVLLGVVGGGVALTGGAGGLALPGLGALIPGL